MNLELEKKKAELSNVRNGQIQLQLKIYERMEDIERIKVNIELQKQAEKELLETIKKLGE